MNPGAIRAVTGNASYAAAAAALMTLEIVTSFSSLDHIDLTKCRDCKICPQHSTPLDPAAGIVLPCRAVQVQGQAHQWRCAR